MVNKFYLDVFDKILNINDKKVFIVFDKNGDIWFCFNELLYAIGYKDPKSSKKDLNIDKKYLQNIKNLKGVIYPPLKKRRFKYNDKPIRVIFCINKK
jgi:hypothetical protein